MRATIPASLLSLAAVLAAAGSPACAADTSKAAAKVGAAAPAFALPSVDDGKNVVLADVAPKSKAVVVLFIATQCPVSNAYNERMAAMGKEYQAKGIAFVGINSNKSEPAAEVKEHAKKHGFTFAVVKDAENKVADAYGAQHTPEVYVVDPKGTLVYHGRIDETKDEPGNVKSPDLKNALDAILAGKPVPVAETRAFGCSIKRV